MHNRRKASKNSRTGSHGWIRYVTDDGKISWKKSESLSPVNPVSQPLVPIFKRLKNTKTYISLATLMATMALLGSWFKYNRNFKNKATDSSTANEIDSSVEDKWFEYFQQGKKHFESGQYEKALSAYKQAVTLDSTQSTSFLNRGVAYFYLQQYQEAAQDFTQAINLDTTQWEGYYYRGLANYASAEKSKLDSIISDLTSVLSFSDSIKEVEQTCYYIRGNVYQRMGHKDLARKNFKTVLTKATSSHYKAIAMMELGSYDMASYFFNDIATQEQREKPSLFDKELLELQQTRLQFLMGSDLNEALHLLQSYNFSIPCFQYEAMNLKSDVENAIEQTTLNIATITANVDLESSVLVSTDTPIPLKDISTSGSILSAPTATPVLDNYSFDDGGKIAAQDNFDIKAQERSGNDLSNAYLGFAFGGGLFLFLLLGILIYRKFYRKHEAIKSLYQVIACRDAKPDSSLQFRKGDVLEVLEEQKEEVLLCYVAGNPEQQGRVREKFINRVIEIETFPRSVCVVKSREAEAEDELSIIKGDYLTATGVGTNGNWLMCHAYQAKPEEQTKQACVLKSSVLSIDLKNRHGLMDKDKLKVLQQQERQRELKEINSKLAQERQQREEKERALEEKKLELVQERQQKEDKERALKTKNSELVQERQQREEKERVLEEKNSELMQERQHREDKEKELEAKNSELMQERQQRKEKERALEEKNSELMQERQHRVEKERKLKTTKSKLETVKSALLPIISSNRLHKEKPPLAEGGYGVVYRGEWLGMTIALKKLKNKNLTNDAIAEFKEEALKMARLRSPYVVTVYGITLKAEKQLKGIVMEYMEGGSLSKILHNREITLSWLVRYKMALAVAQGLSCLHQQNIIHNDLKSANVLVRHYGDEWRLKLTDFGISKIKQETAKSTNTPQGTAAFMAPEVLETNDYSPKSDIYAYGIVLWEIASRDIPFDGLHLAQIIAQVVFHKKRPPISLETPSSLTALMQLCWKQNKAERLPTEDVITKLEALPLKRELREFDNKNIEGEIKNKRTNKNADPPKFEWKM